ncbi:EPHB1 protein, partial [Polypterus senegalus]
MAVTSFVQNTSPSLKIFLHMPVLSLHSVTRVSILHRVTDTGVPSGPRNVISIVNETSVILEWHPPRESGGRDDIMYNIICKKCSADRKSCSRCDDNVEFVPRQLGLTETRVFISSLWAHTFYTFEIQAVNGVSSKSPYPPQHVSVNITTNQAAPSMVPIMHQVSATMKSMTLSWPQPEQPNGIILDYELRFYEKGHPNLIDVMKYPLRLVICFGIAPHSTILEKVISAYLSGSIETTTTVILLQ